MCTTRAPDPAENRAVHRETIRRVALFIRQRARRRRNRYKRLATITSQPRECSCIFNAAACLSHDTDAAQ